MFNRACQRRGRTTPVRFGAKMHRTPLPAIGQRAVCIGQLQQADLGTAQRKAVTVVAAAFRKMHPQPLKLPMKGIRRDHHQRAHSRDVERRPQCRAHRDPALVAMIIVLRHVQAAGRRKLSRRIIQQRSSCQPMLSQCLRIQERLKRTARLASCHHAVHLRGPAQAAAGPHPGQHVAADVVQHHHRTVLDVSTLQLAQLCPQGVNGQALEGTIQRAAHRGVAVMETGHDVLSIHAVGKGGVQVFIHLTYQALRQVRCHTLAGPPVTAMERHARQHLHRQAVRFEVLHLLKQTAGTLRHPGGRGIGRTDERSGQRRFRCIQHMGRLSEQGMREGVNADDLATERHQIQIGFQNLILAPAGFQHPGSTGLRPLLRQAARRAGRSLQGRVQQTGQLHRQRRCTARAFVPQVAPGRCRHGPPVHAAVFMKAPVLRQQQRHPERRRSIAHRHPGASAHLKVGAQPVQYLAMTIQQQRLG